MCLLIRHSLTMSHKLNITIYYLLVSFDCASLQWPVTAHFIPSELHYLKVDYNNPGLIPKSQTPFNCVCRRMQNFTHLALADMRAAPLVEARGGLGVWVTVPSSLWGPPLALLWLADLSLSHDRRHSHMVLSNSVMEKIRSRVPTSGSYWRSPFLSLPPSS